MRRLFNLNTPILALILSVAAEILFMILGAIAGRQGRPGEVTEFSRLWMLFHDHLDRLTLEFSLRFLQPSSSEPTRSILFILLALLQWYIILFVAIFLYRRFRKKTA